MVKTLEEDTAGDEAADSRIIAAIAENVVAVGVYLLLRHKGLDPVDARPMAFEEAKQFAVGLL